MQFHFSLLHLKSYVYINSWIPSPSHVLKLIFSIIWNQSLETERSVVYIPHLTNRIITLPTSTQVNYLNAHLIECSSLMQLQSAVFNKETFLIKTMATSELKIKVPLCRELYPNFVALAGVSCCGWLSWRRTGMCESSPIPILFVWSGFLFDPFKSLVP